MEVDRRVSDLDFWMNGAIRATAYVREENLRLKGENERLENLLSEATSELNLLREERVSLKAAIGALLRQTGAFPASGEGRGPATFATLPHEIFDPIFRLAAAEPTYQFDTSIRPGAHNPWLQLMRMKRGFPLVCRASFWPGMSVLYRDIVLRRMGQVSALAETLRTSDIGSRLGSMVKSIRWDSCVVAAPCSDVVREDLTFIFAQCARLRAFSYNPHESFPLRFSTPESDECEGFFNPLWFIMMPPSLSDPPLFQTPSLMLRSLDMDLKMDDAILQAINRVLPTLNALESLTLGPWPEYPSLFPKDSELMNMPVVSLPSLTTLCVFAAGPAIDQYLCARWEVPQLARLTVLASMGWPGPLLARFGRGLRYLHLFLTEPHFSNRGAYYSTLEASSILLSATCPVLEHLIVPTPMTTTPYPLLLGNSPMLAHIDFWISSKHKRAKVRQDKSTAAYHRSWAIKVAKSELPSLRTVRLLFTSGRDPSRPAWLGCRSHVRDPDWPWICHPRLLPEGSDDVLYYRFSRGWVAQTVAAIIPQDLGEFWWEGRDFYEPEWPAVYAPLDAMWEPREMDAEEEETADKDEGIGEQEDEAEATLCCDEFEREDNVNTECTDGDDIAMSEEAEARARMEQEEREQERLEAAAELAFVPENPAIQLDRATVLAAFRSGRDRESYNHISVLDNHD